MAKLENALDSKSGDRKVLEVRVLSGAFMKHRIDVFVEDGNVQFFAIFNKNICIRAALHKSLIGDPFDENECISRLSKMQIKAFSADRSKPSPEDIFDEILSKGMFTNIDPAFISSSGGKVILKRVVSL